MPVNLRSATDGRVEVKYIVDGARPAGLKSVADNNGIGAYIINYIFLIFSEGSSGLPVYVIADANMPDDAFDCSTIPGLGICTGVISTGYVRFVKRVVPFKSFLEWLNETIILLLYRGRKGV